MPKRPREDEAKPAPRLSAVAQRRLAAAAAAQAPAPTPVTPKPAKKTKSPIRHEENVATTTEQSTSNEELARKRVEIERQIAERVRVLQGGPVGIEVSEELTPARVSSRGSVSPIAEESPSGKGEESALARLKRQREEKRLERTTTEEEDVEMTSPGGRSDEDEVMESVEESAEPVSSRVSSFMPTDENYTATKSSMTFRLQPGETLVLVGIYDISVTRGTVTISGATLSEGSAKQTVYAPMTHALPAIEAPSKRRRDGSEKYSGAEVHITSHHSGIVDVGKLCPTFNGIWKGPSRDQDKHSFAPVYSSTTSIPTITQPSSWKSTLSSLVTRSREAVASGSRPPIILLTGAKGAGKSTFSRILANTLLTAGGLDSIAYLDVDPGQPEFTPSGTISLSLLTAPILGPPFTHDIIPTRWHHVGHTSPREDPGHYIISIIDLLSSYRQSHSGAPLLINTMGWTKGLGIELLQDILAHSQASDVVFLGNGGGTQSVAEIIPANTASLHELASAGGVAPSRFAPADLRTLQTMSYFHRSGVRDWDFTTPLTGFAPWVVPYTGPERGIDAVHILGESIVPEELATAVEGTIVGIVVVAEHNLPETYRASESSLPVITAPLAPEVAECRGLAVIRAIDAANGVVHLLSPVAQGEVERWDREGLRVVLVRGRLDLSPWEMMMPGGGVVDGPWISSGEGKKVGGAVWRVRRNVMRRGQQ